MISDDERKNLIETKLAEELVDLAQNGPAPESWIWVSFADPTLPEGEQFLGVVIAPGNPAFPALFMTSLWEQGLNPGGSMQMWQLPPDFTPAENVRQRLLTREEAEAVDRDGYIS